MRLLVLFFACLCLHATGMTAPTDTAVWIEVTRDAPVTFQGNKLGKATIGMGVSAPDQEIFTAAHVIYGAKEITVVNDRGMRTSALVLRLDIDADIAVIRPNRALAFHAVARVKPVERGEAVSVIGLRTSDNVSTAIWGAIRSATWTSHGIPVPVIHSGLLGEKGMSGGGLYDPSGAILGVIVRVDTELGYLYVLPIGEFCKRFGRCPK